MNETGMSDLLSEIANMMSQNKVAIRGEKTTSLTLQVPLHHLRFCDENVLFGIVQDLLKADGVPIIVAPCMKGLNLIIQGTDDVGICVQAGAAMPEQYKPSTVLHPVLMRVDQEQKVTKDARTDVEQDVEPQRYATENLTDVTPCYNEGRKIRPTIGNFGGTYASNQSPFNNGRIKEWEEDRVSITKIFRSKILINNSVCSLDIDGCSMNNFVSRKLVDFLKLPMEIYRIEGYQVCRVPVTIEKSYKVEVLCIVDDIDECHILLGRPWGCEVNGKYDVKRNLYIFSWEGRKIAMVSPKVTPQLPKPEVKVKEKIVVVSPKVTPQLPKPEVKVKEKIVKDEVIEDHIEKIQDLQSYKQHDHKISTLLFETTNKVGTLKTREEIRGFNDDEDVKELEGEFFPSEGIHVNETKVNAVRDWSSLKTLPEDRNNKVADAFQEEDELKYAEPLDGEAEQVTYVVQRTLCSPKVPLAIGKHYNELVTCDVVDMESYHILLGRPWQHDMDATHQGALPPLRNIQHQIDLSIKTTLLVSISNEVLGFDSIKELYANDEDFCNIWMELKTKQHHDCDDGSRPDEQHLVVLCSSDEEIVNFPTQLATTEISEKDGSNLEKFLNVLTVEEADITGPNMAVEDQPLMMLGSCPNIIKEDFSNDLDGQHLTDESKPYHNTLRGQICMNVWLKQEMVCAQRRTWDPRITWLKILKEHFEDKINDNAYVVDLPNTMSILKMFNVQDIYEFHSEDMNEGKHLRTSSSKETGNDEDMIQKVAEEYMDRLERGKSKSIAKNK
ncbi:hypothetical protein Tco_0072094 [Tanacetum coccineum]